MAVYVLEFHQASVTSILQKGEEKRGKKKRGDKKRNKEETELKDLGERERWCFFQEDGRK